MKRILQHLAVVLSVLLVPLLAAAQTAAPVASPAVSSGGTLSSVLLQFFVEYLVPPLGAAIGGLLVAALSMLTKKLNAEGESSKVKMVLGKVSHFAEIFVTEAEQTALADLKEAAKDGVISPDELAKLKSDVLAKIKAHMGASGLQELAAILGGTGPGEGLVDGYLSGLVETLVRKVSGTVTTTVSETVSAPTAAGGSIVDQVKAVTTDKAPAAAVPS